MNYVISLSNRPLPLGFQVKINAFIITSIHAT